MLNFREWFVINENREEKLLASELAGDALTDLATVIPKNNKNADKLLLLAAYYYSLTKDKEQVKTDMTDYIGYLNKNRMELITVDLVSKKPPSPWDNYLYWTQIIHGHQGEDTFKERSKFKPSQDDFQGQLPFMISPDGKIKVYEANSPQQCIILGRGQSFCISQPGNKNWQGYRSIQTSTFYFVYDDTRPADDRLGIVVIDVRKDGIVLTDRVNTTGTTLDPYNRQLTNSSSSYMEYLKDKGIDISKIVNIRKSPEEKKEQKELGKIKKDFDWFIALSPDYKSKYIGRGHRLTNKQFNYLWKNKFTSLLTQYVKTGLLLNDYQVDKIASNRDLRDNYLHNRSIADQHSGNLSNKEYSLFSFKQKESYYNNMNDDKKLEKAIKFSDLDFYKYLVEKGAKIGDDAISYATKTGNLELVEYLVKKGAKIDNYAINNAAAAGNLELVEYLVKKGAEIGGNAVKYAAGSGNLELVTYLVEKGAKIGDDAISYATKTGNLELVEYLVKKGAKIDDNAVYSAAAAGNLELVKYIAKKIIEKGGKINYSIIIDYVAIKCDNLDIVKYLVDESGLEGNSKILTDLLKKAVKNKKFDLVKYLVDEKGVHVERELLSTDARVFAPDIYNYLKSVRERRINDYLNSVKERE